MKDFLPITECLVCASTDLHPYLDLGSQPLANAFTTTHDLPRYPLGLQVCGSCFHSMLTHAVKPALMFKSYPYVSGTSSSLREYFYEFVHKVERDFDTIGGLRVLEVGSNDGTLLKIFAECNHKVLGVDPATNLMAAAKANGVETINAFFNDKIALPGFYDVIIMMNVLAHTPDPLSMLQTAKRYLAPGGRIYVQTSQAHMLRDGQFDTVYHEHVSFFTAKSFSQLAERSGICITHMSHVNVHGTSYLVKLQSKDVIWYDDDLIERDEQGYGYYSLPWYETFQTRCSLLAEHAVSTVNDCKNIGYKVVGYGAAAKGVVFLNATQMALDYVIDDNPLKVGKLIPGRNIHVTGKEGMQFKGKALWVILSWNMAAEVITKIKAARPDEQDAFLTYFPVVELVQ